MNVNQIKKMLESRANGIKRRRASELQNRLNEVKEMALEQRKNIMNNLAKEMKELNTVNLNNVLIKYKSHSTYSGDSNELLFTIHNPEYIELVNERDGLIENIQSIYDAVEEEIDDLLVDLALHGATPEIAEKVKNLINN